MPRPKGSKNKVKTTKVTADFAAQIAAKQEEKAAVEAEILKVAASIEELKTDVKSLNADLLAEDEALTPEQREQVEAILRGTEQTRTYLLKIRAQVQTPLKYKRP